jgi:hypothetical protein
MFITKTEAAAILGLDDIELAKLVAENLIGTKSDPERGILLRKYDVDGLSQILAPANSTGKQPRLF